MTSSIVKNTRIKSPSKIKMSKTKYNNNIIKDIVEQLDILINALDKPKDLMTIRNKMTTKEFVHKNVKNPEFLQYAALFTIYFSILMLAKNDTNITTSNKKMIKSLYKWIIKYHPSMLNVTENDEGKITSYLSV